MKKKFKVVMLGEGRVGKTSLLQRFIDNTWDENCQSTTRASMYASIKMEVHGAVHEVSIWDTAGQERYHALGPIYYRDAHGAVIVYDITDKDSFEKVKVWLKELHQVVGEFIPIVIIGNKIDIERERKVNKKEVEEFAAAQHAAHFLCSAKLGLKVSEPFQDLVTRIVKAAGIAPKKNTLGLDRQDPAAHLAVPQHRSKAVKVAMDDGPPQKKDDGVCCGSH